MVDLEVLGNVCPMCGSPESLRESIVGLPIDPVDESKFYLAGCTAENVDRIVCINCGMGIAGSDLSDFLEARNTRNDKP